MCIYYTANYSYCSAIHISPNPLNAGAAYIWVFIFYQHIKYHLLNMLKIIYGINQQYLKTDDLHFVKSNRFLNLAVKGLKR